MNVLFNLPARENALFRAEIDAAIADVLDSGYYLLGNHVKGFEQEFASYCRVDHCISVGNGTDALEIALRAVGVQAGDEVISVANAGGYTTIACNIIGAVPVYVDVNADDLLLDIDQVVAAVSERTRCVVATHLYGQVVDVSGLRALLDQAGYADVKILEDCAQAHGATLDGQPVGSLADIATFSFYPTKNLGALGDGGAIVTNAESLAQTCLQLRQYGWKSKYESTLPFGRNSRMDELQAAILRVKLKHLPDLNAKRVAVTEFLDAACRGVVEVVTQPRAGSVGHLFVVRHAQRDKIRAELARHGIATDIHYPLLDMDHDAMLEQPRRVMNMSCSIKATAEIFSLPCYAGIRSDELDHIQQVFDLYISKIV
ncbi:DegT/DnrJ/EryC1/StrS family aminotransferase [Mariprofundus sp. KV]|uniref:DegT/DnrJ/EryC1/StrS family aminotransferase n=1 Tax=Mariprofundus sp. KV TaxID=2608715 RepID=UPI0015A0A282|nr:DegT/DnrJ/EryC1/StrS family aminotransferase [Mariprofundus sp. KV]NWF35748.1 erythromycin biosynthesis sensory transduction protein eryC1 [Mariprofundus sp. KV]